MTTRKKIPPVLITGGFLSGKWLSCYKIFCRIKTDVFSFLRQRRGECDEKGDDAGGCADSLVF